MKRPKSHKIEQAAKRIFESALPDEWPRREQHPDYGIDYVVDVCQEDSLTGIEFAVQLKGTGSPIYKGEFLRFRLETKHLIYYVDKRRTAVFLVVADVSREHAYWLFLQGHALDSWSKRDWRGQRTITIEIPIENDLSATEKLLHAVTAADARMADIRPGAIDSAIAAEKERMESRDRRFEISIAADEGGRQYHLQAKSPVQVQFSFRGKPDDVKQRLADLIDRGLPVNFAPGELSAEGSPLFDRVCHEGATMQVSRDCEGSVSLVGVNAVGEAVGSIRDIPGLLSSGRRQWRFHGQLPNDLLNVRLTAGSQDSASEARFLFDFSPKSWLGQPIRQLPYYEMIAPLFVYIGDIKTLKIQVFAQGNLIASPKLADVDMSPLAHCSALIQMLTEARDISKRFGLNPTLPLELTPTHFEELITIRSLLRDGEYRRSASDLTISLAMPPSAVKRQLNESGGQFPEATLNLNPDCEPFPIFNEAIDLGRYELTVTHARVLTSVTELRDQVERSDGRSVQVTWAGTDHSELTVRLTEGRVMSTRTKKVNPPRVFQSCIELLEEWGSRFLTCIQAAGQANDAPAIMLQRALELGKMALRAMEALVKDPAPSGIVVLSICRPYYEISTRVLWASRGTGHWQRLQRYYANENLKWVKSAGRAPSLKEHAERVRVATCEILDRTDERGRQFKNAPDMRQMLKEIEASDIKTGIKKTEDGFASFEYAALWQIMCRSVHAHMSTVEVATEVHLYWAAHAAATATLALARAIAVVMAADRNELEQLVDQASGRLVQALTDGVNHT